MLNSRFSVRLSIHLPCTNARSGPRYWATHDLDAIKELRNWLGKLGMTPQDRTRLPGQAPKQANPFDEL